MTAVAQSQTPNGEVVGIVTTPDNVPVRGASMSLVNVANRNRIFRIETNEQGRFAISRVPLGSYELSAGGNGFVRVPHLAPPIPLTLSKEQPTAGVRITLASPYSFSGRVFDEGGNPVSAISVNLMRETYSPSGVRWLTAIPGAKVSTNADGEYRFTNIAPGEYFVVATPGRGSSPFLDSFYPGVSSPENATPIKALPGAREDRFDFSLVRGARYSIRVTAPPPNIVSPGVTPTFSLLPAGRGRILTSFNHQTMFEFLGGNVYVSPLVPPDTYTLDVVWASQNRIRIPVEVTDRNIDLGTVMPKEALSITGRLGPYSGGDINSFLLQNLDPETGPIGPPSRSPDGFFRWDWVPEGRYVIAPTPGLQRQGGFIGSVKLGGHEVREDVFELNEGSSKNLEITIRAAASVYGVLQDSKGAGVAFGRVVFVPAPERRANPHMFLTAMSDASGAFKLDGVPPGEYEVFGWEHVEENAYFNESFLRRFDSRATHVRIEPRATNRFLVSVIESAK